MEKIRIFISHSSKDIDLVSKLVSALQESFVIPSGAIRCTSLSGYKLTPGAHTSTTLLEELLKADLIIGVLTRLSSKSSWVLFELGAGWGKKIWTVPLLGGLDFDEIEGPLKEFHAIKTDDEDALLDLFEKMQNQLKLQPQSASIRLSAIRKIVNALKEGEKVKSDAYIPQPEELAHSQMPERVETPTIVTAYLSKLTKETREEEVLPFFNRAVSYHKHDKKILARFYFQLAQFFLKKEEPSKALEYLNISLENSPNDIYTLNSRGKIFIRMKQFKDAEADFKLALEIDSESLVNLSSLMRLYSKNLLEHIDKIPYLSKELITLARKKNDPDSTSFGYALWATSQIKEDPRAAEINFDNALKEAERIGRKINKNRRIVSILRHRIKLYSTLKRDDEAKQDFIQAWNLCLEFPEDREIKNSVEALKVESGHLMGN